MSTRTIRRVMVGPDSGPMICQVRSLEEARFFAERLGTLPIGKHVVFLVAATDSRGNHYAIHQGSLEPPHALGKTVLLKDPNFRVPNFLGYEFDFGYDRSALTEEELEQLERDDCVPLPELPKPSP